MKKQLFTSVMIAGLLASASAFAADTVICPATAGTTTAGPGVAPASGSAGTNYMVSAIKPQCSANTQVAGTDGTNGAWYAVGSNSVKGKTSFKGNTEGGAVAKSADCAKAGGCTADEAVTARTAANTDASTISGGGTGTGTGTGT